MLSKLGFNVNFFPKAVKYIAAMQIMGLYSRTVSIYEKITAHTLSDLK